MTLVINNLPKNYERYVLTVAVNNEEWFYNSYADDEDAVRDAWEIMEKRDCDANIWDANNCFLESK